ncbi:MAG: translation initiation factor IF-2 [Proteobacteria bacterium]|nr:translation initiation factor IF-2 [Pseudomonadota bacterium]MBU0965808.1 translation initiation factor IF-2 [Pseudomonadota bacterium]
MGKIRVYELAKEAGVESKTLTAQLIELGYNVRAYNSTLEDDMAEEIRTRLGFKKVEVQEKRIESKGRTTIIRRRTQAVPDVADEISEQEAAEGFVLETNIEPEIELKQQPAEPIVPEIASVIDEKAVPEVAAGSFEDKEVADSTVVAEDKEGKHPEPPFEAEQPAAAVEQIPENIAETPQSVEDVVTETAAPETGSSAEHVPLESMSKESEIAKTAEQIPQGEPEPKKEEIAPLPKRKKGLAKIIGRTEIPLPVEETKLRAKKIEKPKKPKVVLRPEVETVEVADEDAGKGKGKAKKGKRFVKFTTEPGLARFKKGAKRKDGVDVDVEEIGQLGARIASGVRVMRGHRGGGHKKKKREEAELVSETKAIKKRIKVLETISVGDLAHRMGVKANEIIAKLIGLGIMATVNQALDVDTAMLVANDFGFEVEQGVTEEQSILNLEESESGGMELPRPPVVTVMGHVDHGKTSILDAIRNTDVAAGEAGGITQHIGAHYVRSLKGDLVFLDTPGHAAFTEMRSRGAQVTDVVVLVVAADDGVMDQTKEAINHAKAAGVPILVAVNKIDKPNADPARVKRELAELNLVPEEWGGETIYCETSAKQGMGIDELVESIILQTEILELKADPKRRAKGWVIEAQLHKGRGPVATVLIQHGTLRVGDHFVAGIYHGKVRSLTDDKGRKIDEAGPSMPVEIQGLSGVPKAGDEFVVVPDEKMARSVSSDRQLKSRESELGSSTKISLENLFEKLQEGEMKELRVVLRADVQGTLEAFGKAIQELSTDAIKVKLLHSGTGTIIESDVLLAAASDALIIGFNVRPSGKVADLAKSENVDLRFYDVIYHALDDIRKAMVGLLEPTFEEKVIGKVEVRETFHVPKIGTIAGCYVTDGRIERNAHVRLLRDGIVVFTGRISSLKRFKDDAKEVQSGYECGLGIENYNDIKVGDQLEAFIMEKTEAEL